MSVKAGHLPYCQVFADILRKGRGNHEGAALGLPGRGREKQVERTANPPIMGTARCAKGRGK